MEAKLTRKILVASGILFFLLSGICAAATAPTNFSLSATKTTITATWTAGNFDDAGFYVKWGTDSSSLDNSYTITGTATTSYQITGLDSGTTYYVEIVEYDFAQPQQEASSGTKSITTQSDTTKPAAPTGFGVTSLDDITQSSIRLKWNANSETNIDHYNLYYGTSSGTYGTPVQVSATTYTLTGLNSDKRYYLALTAVTTAGIESDKTDELIVDTLPDTIPPFTPGSIIARMSGVQQITVTINNSNNSGLADFSGLKLYYGETSGSYDHTIDLKKNTTYVLNDRPEESTWYFAATAYDTKGNESGKTSEVSATIEKTSTFLKQSGKFDGGCFISTITGDPTPAPKKNKVGISAAYLVPAESSFKKFYGKDLFPVFAFYERELFSKISVKLSGGYMKKNGDLLTQSGVKTEIASHYTVVPIAASLNYNIPIAPYIWGFVGAGPDYWYCREKSDISGAGSSTSDWVGGYHANAGFWLYNEDPEYENWGVLVEGNYSCIDRFGSNDIDIGGWLIKLGFFYQF